MILRRSTKPVVLHKQNVPQERFKVCMVHGTISEGGRLAHCFGDLSQKIIEEKATIYKTFETRQVISPLRIHM